jgi:hypothetical protein
MKDNKTNIVVVDRNGKTSATCYDESSDALAYYEKQIADTKNDFVRVLCKPREWYKHRKPKSDLARDEATERRKIAAALEAENQRKRTEFQRAQKLVVTYDAAKATVAASEKEIAASKTKTKALK